MAGVSAIFSGLALKRKRAVDVQARDKALQQCLKDGGAFLRSLGDLRGVASFDEGKGQPFTVTCSTANLGGRDNSRKVAPSGTKMRANVEGAGATGEDTVVVDTEVPAAANIADAAGNGVRRFSGRLHPALYLPHDKHVLQVLHHLAAGLQPDELSALKVPPGKLTGDALSPEALNPGYVARKAPRLDLGADRHAATNRRRQSASDDMLPANFQSGVSEILEIARRVAQPELGLQACGLPPLPHFGLSPAMQDKLGRERVEAALRLGEHGGAAAARPARAGRGRKRAR